MTADVNGYHDVTIMTGHTVHRDGIRHTAVDEYHTVALHRFIERRQRDGGSDGLEETALAEYHFATCFPVGGYGTIGDWQVLNGHVRHKLHDGLDNTRTFYYMIQT